MIVLPPVVGNSFDFPFVSYKTVNLSNLKIQSKLGDVLRHRFSELDSYNLLIQPQNELDIRIQHLWL